LHARSGRESRLRGKKGETPFILARKPQLVSATPSVGMAWHTYLNVERDFIDITHYVALDRTNKAVLERIKAFCHLLR